MTTITYKDGVMAGDGQVTRYDSLIESTNYEKVREIGGYLVGGAGNGNSIVKFFNWFEDTLETEHVNRNFPLVQTLPPEDLVEEDFQAIVVTPEKEIFEYIGTKNVFPVVEETISIGSGCVYAYPLMDAGFSAKEAVEGAVKRDPYSGGTIRTVSLEEVEKPITKEDLEGKSKEEILALLFPSTEVGADVIESNEEDSCSILFSSNEVTVSLNTLTYKGVVINEPMLDKINSMSISDAEDLYLTLVGEKFTGSEDTELLYQLDEVLASLRKDSLDTENI